MKQYFFYDLIKRFIDISVAVVGLILLSPFLIVLICLIALDGANPFYKQMRIGYQGRTFNMWKLRSMMVNADLQLKILLENNESLRDDWDTWRKLKSDPRATVIGKWLRRMSLDELPQLWNVLIGDMSLIGPRPILSSELELWGEKIVDYQSIRPGITGLWQISGRNQLSYKERISLDVEYIQHRSWWLDTVIAFKTIRVVFLSIGAH
jgi:lipopolysaccharide/colanic/teichoic acid biosynthesis glycosyltransferase